MESDQRQQLNKYTELLLRHKILLISSLFVGCFAGLFTYLSSPKIYESRALIMYQQQRINPTQMSPDETRRMDEMLSTVSQQVTSRSNLERIIDQYKLFEKQRQARPLEDLVNAMREKLIGIRREQARSHVFSVSFKGSDPQQVMQVTNGLAALFIEENIRFREARASETSAYIRDELVMAKNALDTKEAIMRDYKLKYYNEMPEQREANMTRLNALQEQYNATQNNVHNLEQTRLLIFEQIALRKNSPAVASHAGPGHTGPAAGQGGPEVTDLASARMALAALLTKYTEEHPDVQRLKSQIQLLEEQKRLLDKEGKAGAGQEAASRLYFNDPQLEQLHLQLKEVEMTLSRLNAERVSHLQQIKKYQEWIDATPIREAEWSALTRDYNELRRHYDELVAKNLAAESAETLERRQKGSQFKIIDPAYLPEKPSHPVFLKLMAMAMAISLGLALTWTFATDVLDASFRDAADIESSLGIPVICSIPMLLTNEEKRRNRLVSMVWGSTLVVSTLGLLLCFIFFWRQGFIVF